MQFMTIAAKSRSSLQIDKCDFNKLVYLDVFSCGNLPLTTKYTSEKLIAT